MSTLTLSPYQQAVAARLAAGCRLKERMRPTGYGILWDHRVTVLVSPEGEEMETVNSRSVARLVAAGFTVEVLDGNR